MLEIDRLRTARGLAARFGAFVAERHPFALTAVAAAFDALLEEAGDPGRDPDAIDRLREPAGRRFETALANALPHGRHFVDTTPGVAAERRLAQARAEVVEACDAFLRRESLAASLTNDERREILRGMILTRATDNRLKQLFSGGEVRYEGAPFQGKGFRSLGQEAIYACAIRLRRGAEYRDASGVWRGDVVAPVIRDLGAALGMHPEAESVRMVLGAQMGKSGPPMDGKDLHIGDFSRGVLPPAAPLAISTLTAVGLGFAFAREGTGRVALSFVGEGGSSLGEWHEAINIAAVSKLPVIFCVENNQTALSTPVAGQSAVRVFADKAAGYGIPGITIDGTDPDAVAGAFAWAAERARAGAGPALIELVAMRMCGHAHHDDMLYVGREPQTSWGYPTLTDQGYADRDLWEFWLTRDPIPRYAALLESEGIVRPGEVDRWKAEIAIVVDEEARKVIAAPWPEASDAGVGVLDGEPPRTRVEILEPGMRRAIDALPLPVVEPAPSFDPAGRTFLDAVMLGVGDALRADPRVFVYGEDVGGKYGNAFLLLKPLLAEFGGRIVNAPLAEGGILGLAIGAALGGLRPIAEMQFNDFVASGFNQLVNNAAKIRYRWGASVPMVVRMPWGGLRHAGPYHSQNTEAWFYRTPGLKIVAPSTPHDARAFMAAAVADPDPVLYYEHIALYRDPRIRQKMDEVAPTPLPLGKAALRRAGNDLAIVTYGAYVHVAMRVAEALAADGIEAAVLDLRSLVPLDRGAILALARHCGRVLIAHEDTRTGSIGESIAAIVQEEAFEYLDAPVRIVGALDTPVPYSPPLEAAFLPGEQAVERAARLLVGF
jgi:2-oxoisovalerate dehydrogenase E1 component